MSAGPGGRSHHRFIRLTPSAFIPAFVEDVGYGSRPCENPIDAMIPLLNRGGMMKGFVQGADRQQTTLLPECVDDWVDESNPVRAVDVFVDALELRDLGFGAGAERGLPACVAAELARPLRPIDMSRMAPSMVLPHCSHRGASI